MKGDESLVKALNGLLADELTAINQYMVHSEMCDSWGYERLHKGFEKRAIDEMKHAERLIGRILFLEGRPTVSILNPMAIGSEVAKQLENDKAAEEAAIKAYNAAIDLAAEKGDLATADFLQQILNDEDGHLDDLEALIAQVRQMGLPSFLGAQLKD